jgi:CRP-like cAMP-binding protein
MICRLHDFPEDSWVVNSDLVGESPRTQWTWSFFKALAMMIMIGFETPPFTNVNCEVRSDWCGIENWITLCCLYIGAVFYSLLISSVASILNSANMSSRIFEEKLGKLDDYMRSQKLPASLREKVKDHFHMQHADGKLFDEKEILGSVTPILRREIVSYKNREVLLKVPLLQDTEENEVFAHEVCTCLSSEIVFMDETVIREDTTGTAMFFIFSGVIEIFLNSAADLTYVAVGDGCYFGEVSIILDCKRTASARTKTQCLLYRLSADDLKRLLSDFADQTRYMQKIARARQKRIVAYLGLADAEVDEDEEQDEEDAKTDLFGTDADEMMIRKDQEFEKYRQHARISMRSTHTRKSGSASGREKYSSKEKYSSIRISGKKSGLERCVASEAGLRIGLSAAIGWYTTPPPLLARSSMSSTTCCLFC